jgi:hypothetical protein
MTLATTQGADRFEEISDNDVETLIRGGIPTNTDLIPLRRVVAELRSLGHWPISESFIEFHAAEAAELCAARHAPTSVGRRQGRRVVDSVRRRTATAAATLAMFASATGVAVASDAAVPGDWNYGIDRALEVVGIGAGGEAERLDELQAIEGSDVATAHASERLARINELLAYIQGADRVDGATVSDMANDGSGKPEDPGAVGRANQPEDPGAAGRANQPDDPGAAGRANQPEDPGATGGGSQPEDPGAAGRANKAEDQSAAGDLVQEENADAADKENKAEDQGAAGGLVQSEDRGGADRANKPEKAATP